MYVCIYITRAHEAHNDACTIWKCNENTMHPFGLASLVACKRKTWIYPRVWIESTKTKVHRWVRARVNSVVYTCIYECNCVCVCVRCAHFTPEQSVYMYIVHIYCSCIANVLYSMHENVKNEIGTIWILVSFSVLPLPPPPPPSLLLLWMFLFARRSLDILCDLFDGDGAFAIYPDISTISHISVLWHI